MKIDMKLCRYDFQNFNSKEKKRFLWDFLETIFSFKKKSFDTSLVCSKTKQNYQIRLKLIILRPISFHIKPS